MTDSNETIGRVKTVLVFGRGSAAKAVMSHMLARRIDAHGRWRLRFSGTVQFSPAVKKHIRITIVSLIDRVSSSLQLPQRNFELSAVNLGAASALDVGVRICGFSADVAVLVALLSTALQMPVADDFVATGHVASMQGDIRAVKGIPAKVHAAEQDDTIRRFIYPDLDQDQSLQALSPSEREQAIIAVMAAREDLTTRAVRGIDEVVKEIFTEEDVILAALKEGFFRITGQVVSCGGPVGGVLSFLSLDHERRFWRALEQCFLAGQDRHGKRLLAALANHLITDESYSSDMGAKLLNLMRSLPPLMRRPKIEWPLLDTALCLKLADFAARADHQDVLRLLDAVHGKGLTSAGPESLAHRPATAATCEADGTAFDAVVAQIDEQALAHRFGIPVDSARGSYLLEASTVQSQQEFVETLEAFYAHLHRWISGGVQEALDAEQMRSGAIHLLEAAFRGQGGYEAAYARARDGTQGGMRAVLDTVAEQFKRERCSDHVRKVFREAVSALDWDGRVQFMRAALKHLAPFLPPWLTDEPPERFVRQYEAIVRTYVESWDRFNRVLRTL